MSLFNFNFDFVNTKPKHAYKQTNSKKLSSVTQDVKPQTRTRTSINQFKIVNR